MTRISSFGLRAAMLGASSMLAASLAATPALAQSAGQPDGAAAEEALARNFPDYAETLRPRPLTIPAAQALLGKGDAYILPLVYPDRVVTLLLTAEGFATGMATTPIHQGRDLIVWLRASLEAGLEAGPDEPDSFDAASAHALSSLPEAREELEALGAAFAGEGAQLALIAARDLSGAASPAIWAPFVLIE